MRIDVVTGSILGTAVGDAIGLPYEALSRRRAQRLLGPPDRHRFARGRGMVSDDTEHTCLVARALCVSGGDVLQFRRSLAWGMRWWLLGLPAGIGFATLRAILKLWLGFPPSRSGVFSAGNGPAMRSAVLGAAVDDIDRLVPLVRASTEITHSDPRALVGALAVALAARQSAQGICDARRLVQDLSAVSSGPATDECCALVERARARAEHGESTLEFAEHLGCANGVTGYILHTLPVAVHAWLSYPADFARAVEAAVRCGGDTDTVAAIVGGIVGARTGESGIPAPWLDGLWEWPNSVARMRELAEAVAASVDSGRPRPPPPVFPLWVLARNAVFTLIVLAHVGRRALPPY
jgi:ADP-ribosylglycohydrolase